MSDLTPLEAAEKLESLIDYAGDTLDDALKFNLRKVVDTTASYLRAIAAGEYKQVVYAHWVRINDTQEQMCSECGQSYDIYAYRQDDYTHCPSCGALMDGKDGKS